MKTARVLGILGIASGAGFMTYGASVEAKDFRAPFGFGGLWAHPSEVLGWGVGLLVAGLLVLLLFSGRARGAQD